MQLAAIMPIAPFPHEYAVSLAGDQLSESPRDPIRAGTPPQFGGREDVWSPEHLLVGAALLCLKTTFAAYAARGAVQVYDWRGRGLATLEKGPAGPVFSSIRLEVELETDAGSESRAEELLATAERNCIVSRALNVPVRVVATCRARATRAAG